MPGLGIYLTHDCKQSCAYCFKEHVPGSHVTVEDFQAFCDWIKKNKCDSVNIAGGEPSTHPEFARLLDMVRRCGDPKIQLISNLMCGDDKLEAMHHCSVLVNSSVPHTPPQRKLFEKNLKRLVELPGTTVYLSQTRWRTDQEEEHIIRYCRELGVRHVRFDFARASILNPSNAHVTMETLDQFKGPALSLIKKLMRMGVVVNFDCYLPDTLFTDEEKAELEELGIGKMRLVDAAKHTCHMMYVNPDLSISSCPFRVIDERKITEFPDWGTLYATVGFAIRKKLAKEATRPEGPVLCMAERFLPKS